jgi:proteasome lid subunit RPN8/RPN11
VTVTILRPALAEAVVHLRACVPHEGVGLLAGRAVFPGQPCPADTNGDGDCGRRFCPMCGLPPEDRQPWPLDATGLPVRWGDVESGVHLDTWVPLANVSEFPRLRYEADPVELLAVQERLEADGRYPWTIVHSHVRSNTAPSETDIEFARNPRQLHLIVSLGGLSTVFQLWRLTPGAEGPERAVRMRWRVVDLHKQSTGTTDLTHGVTGA